MRYCQTIESERITHSVLVPAILYRLLDLPEVQSADLSSLQTIFYGAAAILPRLVECALAAGVKVEDRVWDGMPHVFQAFGFLPEAQKARQRACRFLLAHTREAPVPAI